MLIAKKTFDYLIYIGISIGVLTGIVIAAESGVSKDTFSLWYAFIMFSSFLFGQFILSSKRFWRIRSFWFLTSIAVLAHTVAFMCAVRSGLHLGTWGWIICVTVEAGVLLGVRETLMRNEFMR